MKVTKDDNAVKQALEGIIKNPPRTFFIIDPATGHHVKVSVSERLAKIGLSHNHIGPIFKTFPFPEAAYYSESMRHADEARGRPKGKPPRTKPPINATDSYDFAMKLVTQSLRRKLLTAAE